MDLIDFIALFLAATAVVDLWWNGTIFDTVRAYFDARQSIIDDEEDDLELEDPGLPSIDVDPLDNPYKGGQESSDWVDVTRAQLLKERQEYIRRSKAPLWMRVADKVIPDWFVNLMLCPFCFSHHAPWLLLVAFYVPSLFVEGAWAFVLKVPIYSLAATRLGTILHAILPYDARYLREEEEPTRKLEDISISDFYRLIDMFGYKMGIAFEPVPHEQPEEEEEEEDDGEEQPTGDAEPSATAAADETDVQ